MSGRRWRPSLAFVLGGALCGTLALSLAGLLVLRTLGPDLGRRETALVLALLILGATGLLGWLLLRLLLRPIRALEAYAIAAQGAAAPLPPEHFGTRETHRTAQAVVAMATALRDREAGLRAYSDHVTHELKTPVSAIVAAVEMLEDGPSRGAEETALLQGLAGAARQIEGQLSALRDAARARETRYFGTTTLAALVARLREDHPALMIRLAGETLVLPMSSEGMAIVLHHLAQNAQEAGAKMLVLTAQTGADGAVLDVQDDGPGIPAALAARIFEPFFTTRRDEGGTGMGLTILSNLLAAHGATVEGVPAPRGAHLRLQFAAAG
ncbi:sensor histidine kinase [Neotabrizicola sp. sgz301269]|uniref:sensor histidine kinase n=1 Tax=Neotabrizicola sp. sgz301269 TaxID=3276282 RepID=UPI00376FC24A